MSTAPSSPMRLLVAYAAVFGATVWSFVHWYEEPSLRRRFGADCEEYLRTVRGWWPRLLRKRGPPELHRLGIHA